MTSTRDFEIAQRVPMSEARKRFADGATVVVSTHRSRTMGVGKYTVTHHRDSTTWDALETQCRHYGLRRHSFYVLETR